MIRVGIAPFLECSTRGDKRFSAFHACPKSLGGLSIEQAYQAMKVFEDGSKNLSWKQAKGRRPINIEECQKAYKSWWEEWVVQENLKPVLKATSGLSDMFGQNGHICQAIVLWEIRNASNP